MADRELAVAIALEPRVERRLLLKLRQLAERWGRVTPDGIRLDLHLTHQELANMIGAVRESVTIALGRLASAGEIEVRNRTLLIRAPVEEEAPADEPPRSVILTRRPRGPDSLEQSAWGTAGGTRRRSGRGVEIALRAGDRPGRATVGQRADGSLAVRVEEGDPERVAQELREVLLLDLDTAPFRELHGTTRSSAPRCAAGPGCAPSAAAR